MIMNPRDFCSRLKLRLFDNNNPGAYWESGFAEVLGRPVIYTCEREFSDQIHFEANHCHTVIWDAEDLAEAGEQLKATIRETLPSEAKMTDN